MHLPSRLLSLRLFYLYFPSFCVLFFHLYFNLFLLCFFSHHLSFHCGHISNVLSSSFFFFASPLSFSTSFFVFHFLYSFLFLCISLYLAFTFSPYSTPQSYSIPSSLNACLGNNLLIFSIEERREGKEGGYCDGRRGVGGGQLEESVPEGEERRGRGRDRRKKENGCMKNEVNEEEGKNT